MLNQSTSNKIAEASRQQLFTMTARPGMATGLNQRVAHQVSVRPSNAYVPAGAPKARVTPASMNLGATATAGSSVKMSASTGLSAGSSSFMSGTSDITFEILGDVGSSNQYMGLASSGPTMSMGTGTTQSASKGNRVGFSGSMTRPMAFSRSNASNMRMMAAVGDGPVVSGDSGIVMKEDHMDKGFASKLTIEDIDASDLKGKKVLMRVDFNVPMKDGKITDPKRIVATLPSIKYLIDQGAGVIILMSHMGRPDGLPKPEFSLKPVSDELSKLLDKPVTWVEDCAGDVAKKAVDNAKEGDILLLENLRYYTAETGKGVNEAGEKVKATDAETKSFREDLSSYGDVYVNDAFGTAHRAHSSMVGVDVDTRAAGLLMGKELKSFGKVLDNPERPLTVVMGGAKVTDKIKLIYNMLDIVDEMIIGGGMAYTFDKVLNGTEIGGSLWDEEGAKTVPDIMKKAEEKGVKIHLPTDYMCGSKFAEDADTEIRTQAEGVKEGWMGLDIGPETIKSNSEVIKRSKTIFWNGPQGVFEMKKFEAGSMAMLDDIIAATAAGATSVAGGGDTVALLKKVDGSADKLSHVSTGGGAALELVEGKDLPGVVALSDK